MNITIQSGNIPISRRSPEYIRAQIVARYLAARGCLNAAATFSRRLSATHPLLHTLRANIQHARQGALASEYRYSPFDCSIHGASIASLACNVKNFLQCHLQERPVP